MIIEWWKMRFAFAKWRLSEEVGLPDGPRAFLFLAADYGNLGDIAITLAQWRFLKRTLPNHCSLPVPISKTTAWLDSIAKQIRPDDLITTVGGGNTGNLYPDIEALRRLVIRAFPNNAVITFPQSIDFGAVPNRAVLERFIEPYRSHPKLTMCIREGRSYGKLLPLWNWSERLLHVPDIVLSHPRQSGGEVRNGVVLSLRHDREKLRDLGDDEHVRTVLAKRFNTITERDTQSVGRFVNWSEAEDALEQHLDTYRRAELVVTDRLHGMILAERVGTPCIAIDNTNHKVSATYYDWLGDNPRIRLLKSAGDDFDQFINSVLRARIKGPAMNEEHPAFAPLVEALTRGSRCGFR